MKLSVNKLRVVVTLFWVVLITASLNFKTENIGSVLSATSPWTQTDWSGGLTDDLAIGTVDTYKYQQNIETSVSGQISLQKEDVWFDESWGYRREILMDNTTDNLGISSEVFNDFPILVQLDTESFNYENAKSDGTDIRFTDSDAVTELDYMIETWDPTDVSYLWVKIPQIDADSDADKIYIYYGNESAEDAQNPEGVWSNNFVAVWLFKDPNDTSVVADSATSPTAHDGTLMSGLSNSNKIQSGIGGALSFTSSTTLDYIVIGSPEELNFVPNAEEFTIDAWIKLPINGSGSIISKASNVNAESQYNFYVNSNTLQARVGGTNRSSGTIVSDDSWKQVVLRNYFESTYRFSQYVNGELKNAHSNSGAGTTTNDVLIGARRNTTNENIALSLSVGVELSMVRVANVARSPAWIAASYKSENNEYLTFQDEEYIYESSGYLLSNIFDGEVLQDWGILNYTKSGTGNVIVKARTGNESDLSDAEQNWSNCANINSATSVHTGNCVSNKTRYAQYRIELSTNSANTPIIEDVEINFTLADVTRPPVNATNISIDNFSEGDWTKSKPTISWDAGSDNEGGSGILGYCISLDEAEADESHLLNPESNAGILNSLDDGVVSEACPYIVTSEEINLAEIQGLTFTSGKQYYFSIRAIDNSDNINNSGDYQDLISFKYDDTPPTPPSYLSMPTNFLSSKSVTITWPSSGPGSPNDEHSQLAGLQYRIGPAGTWYGDLHSGLQDINDLLINDGSYTTDPDHDYENLIEGTNFFYIRAIDNVGNFTTEDNLTVGLIKINTTAPSKVQNLFVDPSNNSNNTYSFSWNPPATFTGQVSALTYCYTVNTIPDENTCTFTSPGITTLQADAFATQPGINTFYIVAKDEAGNINYATYTETGASIAFTYSGSAPGIPINTDISDISVKASQNWRLVVSWDRPSNIGAGISYYNVYRASGGKTCSSDFNQFTKVGSSNSTSFIDPELQPVLYSYCIKACDSANNCSASSSTSNKIPTGKFTEAASLAGDVEVFSVTTRKALISWVTDRVSDTKIEYGLESGKYFEEEVGNSLQVISHNITLNNLSPGTTYFFRAKWTDVDGNTGYSDEKTFSTLPPPVISNVASTAITTNSALVTFQVRNATRATLVYGNTLSYGGSEIISTSTELSEYTIRLSGLLDNSTYNYKFFLQDIDGNENDTVVNFQFATLALPEIINLRFEEVKNIAEPTVKVFWETNVDTLGFISYYPNDRQVELKTQAENEYNIEHEIAVSGLFAETNYVLFVTSRDSLGNTIRSGDFAFTTASDSRPPEISNVKTETRLASETLSFGEEVKAQIIVSWDTDELATSQVQYALGTTGDYTQKTSLDENLSFNHLVVINNLNPSSVYKLQILSRDDAGNEAQGKNIVTISAQSKENPLEIILGRLAEIFKFLN